MKENQSILPLELENDYPKSKLKMSFELVNAISSMTGSFYFGNICYIENELETGKAIRSALRISLPLLGLPIKSEC